ncbi:MAG: lipoprotein [Gammaproteobacteria bacterium]
MAIRVPRPIKFIVISCAFAMVVAGCGQKGDLYLPDARAASYTTP